MVCLIVGAIYAALSKRDYFSQPCMQYDQAGVRQDFAKESIAAGWQVMRMTGQDVRTSCVLPFPLRN